MKNVSVVIALQYTGPIQLTFISTCPSISLCEMSVVVLSPHCGVRASTTAAVASSFNISLWSLWNHVLLVYGCCELNLFLNRYSTYVDFQVLANVITGQHMY